MLDDLPNELLVQIFRHLNVKDLLNLCRVSRFYGRLLAFHKGSLPFRCFETTIEEGEEQVKEVETGSLIIKIRTAVFSPEFIPSYEYFEIHLTTCSGYDDKQSRNGYNNILNVLTSLFNNPIFTMGTIFKSARSTAVNASIDELTSRWNQLKGKVDFRIENELPTREEMIQFQVNYSATFEHAENGVICTHYSVPPNECE